MTGERGRLERIPIGGQLGHLEYTVTAANLQAFREAVGYPAAAYPHLALREGLEVLGRKYGAVSVADAISIRRSDRYYCPPTPGRRVQVTGWAREARQERGGDRLTVETFAVDEIGAEIVRSEHTLRFGLSREAERQGRRASRVGNAAALETLPPLERQVTEESIDRWAAVGRLLLADGVGDSSAAGLGGGHSGAELAMGMGLAAVVAPGELGLAWLYELLDRRFGIDFRQGGWLTVNYRRPVYAGDTLTAQATITRQETDTHGRVRHQLQVWLANQRGERAIDGTAQVTVPSPLT